MWLLFVNWVHILELSLYPFPMLSGYFCSVLKKTASEEFLLFCFFRPETQLSLLVVFSQSYMTLNVRVFEFKNFIDPFVIFYFQSYQISYFYSSFRGSKIFRTRHRKFSKFASWLFHEEVWFIKVTSALIWVMLSKLIGDFGFLQ